jgi:Uncharacterized protein conserved in bacteria
MSLTKAEKNKTINELNENFKLSGLTKKQVAQDLKTNVEYIDDLLNLKAKRIEDPWILKNFLQKYNHQIQFTALSGDYHKYWFLNSAIIDRGVLN